MDRRSEKQVSQYRCIHRKVSRAWTEAKEEGNSLYGQSYYFRLMMSRTIPIRCSFSCISPVELELRRIRSGKWKKAMRSC